MYIQCMYMLYKYFGTWVCLNMAYRPYSFLGVTSQLLLSPGSAGGVVVYYCFTNMTVNKNMYNHVS